MDRAAERRSGRDCAGVRHTVGKAVRGPGLVDILPIGSPGESLVLLVHPSHVIAVDPLGGGWTEAVAEEGTALSAAAETEEGDQSKPAGRGRLHESGLSPRRGVPRPDYCQNGPELPGLQQYKSTVAHW